MYSISLFYSTSSAGGLQIQFKSNGDSESGRGFLLQYSLVDVVQLPERQRCGGMIVMDYSTTAFGSLRMPEIPTNSTNTSIAKYPSNMLCIWKVLSVEWGYSGISGTVLLSFPRFELENSFATSTTISTNTDDLKDEYTGDNCQRDYVEVLEGNNFQRGKALFKLCGSRQSWPLKQQQLFSSLVYHSGKTLWVVFKSNDNVQLMGFQLDFRLQMCGAAITTSLSNAFGNTGVSARRIIPLDFSSSTTETGPNFGCLFSIKSEQTSTFKVYIKKYFVQCFHVNTHIAYA